MQYQPVQAYTDQTWFFSKITQHLWLMLLLSLTREH